MNKLEDLSQEINLSVFNLCSKISVKDISECTLSNPAIPRHIATSNNFSTDEFEYDIGKFNIILNKNSLTLEYSGIKIINLVTNNDVEYLFQQLTPLVQKERENYNKHIGEFFSSEIDLEEDEFNSSILY